MNDRFEELYERYGDGELTAEEREEFLALLGDPAMRARFVELSAYEVALSEELQVTAAGRRSSSKHLPAIRLRRTAEPKSFGPAIAAAVALAFIGILALAFANSRPAAEKPAAARARETRAPAPAPPPPAPVPAPRETPPRPAAPDLPRPFDSAQGKPEPVPPPREPEPAPAREPAPPPPPIKEPPAPAPKPAPTRPQEQESVVFIAHLERAQGDVDVVTAKGAVRAEPGRGIQAGQGVRAGRESHAVVKFPDGTTVRLWPETRVAALADGPASGKSVQLEQGIVGVDAVKQPANRPMTVSTGLAEATVVGTEFAVAARPSFTRLDVREGRVRFARAQGGAPLTVPAGHFAIAGAGHDFAVRTQPDFWKAPAPGLALWLRADKGVKTNGAAVVDWLDASPYGAHASQRSPASQPALVPNAFAGRPAVKFDGVNDFLSLPPGFNNFRAGLSLLVVGRIGGSPGGWVRLLELSNGGADDNISFVRKDGQVLTFWAYDGGGKTTKIDAQGGWSADQLLSLSVVLGPKGNVAFYRNGASVGSGTTSEPAAVTRRQNAIGKSSYAATDPYFQGEIAEMILYARGLSDAERQHVEAYLHSKYLDATAPPAWPGETK